MRTFSRGAAAHAQALVSATKQRALHASRHLVAKAPRGLLETLALILVTFVGVGVLFALDTTLNHGLWGEWGFAFVVTWIGIWLAGHALSHYLHFQPPKILQALVWAALPLIGLPFAVMTLWWGPVLLLGVGTLVLFALPRLPWRAPRILQPMQWIAAALAVIAVWGLIATRTSTDHARLADGTRPVKDAIELAYRYRPILRFDSREHYFPLKVDWAMQNDLVSECRYSIRTTDPTRCRDVTKPGVLDSSYDYLTVEKPEGREARPGGSQSGFYVHAVRKDREIFLDYWIYYTQNPNPFARGLFCAPGLQWGELTCFDHAGDWEGVVVTLQACDRSTTTASACHTTAEGPMRIVAVSYAEHRGVTRFAWNTLSTGWKDAGLPGAHGERPLVYVARDSHASYPRPCPDTALTPHARALRSWPCGFDDANGHVPWPNNSPQQCAKRCLTLLPTDATGTPTGWDAFPGHWGEQTCILYGGYCDLGTAPRAPAFQSRYKEPWHTS